MKKKIPFSYCFLLIFACLFYCSLVGNPLDDFFKNFNLDNFLNEVEKSYDEEINKKPADSTEQQTQPNSSEVSPQKIAAKKTRDELFLSPTIVPQTKERPSDLLLTKESLQAFKEVMHELISLVSAVATKVDNSSLFSLPFKEEFAKYHETIDKIAVSYGLMVSKKLYSKIIPFKQITDNKTPQKNPQPQEYEKLRQNILDAIKELKKIDNELTTAIAKTPSESTGAEIQDLARTPREKIEFDLTPLTKKHKRIHQPSSPVEGVKS